MDHIYDCKETSSNIKFSYEQANWARCTCFRTFVQYFDYSYAERKASFYRLEIPELGLYTYLAWNSTAMLFKGKNTFQIDFCERIDSEVFGHPTSPLSKESDDNFEFPEWGSYL